MKTKQLTHGAIAGIAGALVFGLMMLMMGMLGMVGKLIGTESLFLAFVYHLFNGAIIGLTFALFFGSRIRGLGGSTLYGLVYGIVWWFLGPLLLMPIMLGMGSQLHVEGMIAAMPSLIGHIIFGIVMGVTFGMLRRSATLHTT